MLVRTYASCILSLSRLCVAAGDSPVVGGQVPGTPETLQTLLATVTQPDPCTILAPRDHATITLLDQCVAPVLRDLRAIATKKKIKVWGQFCRSIQKKPKSKTANCTTKREVCAKKALKGKGGKNRKGKDGGKKENGKGVGKKPGGKIRTLPPGSDPPAPVPKPGLWEAVGGVTTATSGNEPLRTVTLPPTR